MPHVREVVKVRIIMLPKKSRHNLNVSMEEESLVLTFTVGGQVMAPVRLWEENCQTALREKPHLPALDKQEEFVAASVQCLGYVRNMGRCSPLKPKWRPAMN